ncbi:hypothetical protein BEN48_16550 [Hymenobacter glacialis]|uniref:BAAT/Acyl-CoA thioester hydrolase C-terminal domain-containing protein n=2 Tax=Hymenobacter glacialis TaxID=1908236 RepID=A0A1G1SZQ7_9BACT|nr:hypothetical protein BEN48_16550 [Hymenobacter glacialis]
MMRHLPTCYNPTKWVLGLMWLVIAFAGCQSQQDQAGAATPPPVGHYEGSITLAGQPAMRAALDIRHPSPGHYEAELTVPTTGTLSFVADTIFFNDNQLRLRRPARPTQVLNLTLDGDFWRGSLDLDSAKAEIILLKRGMPTPSTYRVEELAQDGGSAWLFSPSDTGTPGAALALLPDTETAPAAALWADALAREGIIVLMLPAVDSASAPLETPRLQVALNVLRATPGADTASIGVWAAGMRAAALAESMTGPGALQAAFVIIQNVSLSSGTRTALRELRNQKVPILALYGGSNATPQQALLMRNALGGRRGAPVRTYRGAGPDLLVPNALSTRFGPGLPNEVVAWLHSQ